MANGPALRAGGALLRAGSNPAPGVMWIWLFTFFVGMILMMKFSDYAVDYSIKLSKLTGIMKMTIGIIIIAIMTSLPELSVSITASLSNAQNLIYGTMVGSNIADILLVMGGTALVYGIGVGEKYLKRAKEIIIITSLLLLYGLFYGYDSTFGLMSLLIFFFLSDSLLHQKYKDGKEKGSTIEILIILGKLILIIVMILISAEVVTRSSIELSKILGISETLLGATVVGITTSFPELMVALSAARKKEMGIIFGTVFGSCFVNIALILGLSATISTIGIGVREIALLASLLLTYGLALLFMKYKMDRMVGMVMLSIYTLIIIVLSSFG